MEFLFKNHGASKITRDFGKLWGVLLFLVEERQWSWGIFPWGLLVGAAAVLMKDISNVSLFDYG